MAGNVVKIRMNSAGVIALLKSAEVAGDLAGRAAAIKEALPIENGEEWQVNTFMGGDRAQATVRTANFPARKTAATSSAMQSALSAGR